MKSALRTVVLVAAGFLVAWGIALVWTHLWFDHQALHALVAIEQARQKAQAK